MVVVEVLCVSGTVVLVIREAKAGLAEAQRERIQGDSTYRIHEPAPDLTCSS